VFASYWFERTLVTNKVHSLRSPCSILDFSFEVPSDYFCKASSNSGYYFITTSSPTFFSTIDCSLSSASVTANQLFFGRLSFIVPSLFVVRLSWGCAMSHFYHAYSLGSECETLEFLFSTVRTSMQHRIFLTF